MAYPFIIRFCKHCKVKFTTSHPNRFYCSHKCRFLDKIKIANKKECWEFKGCLNKDRYGRFSIGFKEIKAHRFSWELFRGEIPPTLLVLHKCDNPPCCNPSHLFLGTKQDNVTDMMQKGRRRSDQGILNPQANLNESAVLAIRKMIKRGTYLPVIAKTFHISLSSIYDIKDNRTWNHV